MIDQSSKFHFRGQMENEIVKDFYRHHWITLLPKLFFFIVFIAIMVLLIANIRFFQPSLDVFVFEVIAIFTMIVAGVLMHRFFMNVLEYFMNVVIITNDRVVIVKRSLFIHDDKESIYMKEIQDIQKQQSGIIKNILHYGELLINVGVPDLTVLKLVPHPDYHFRLLSLIRYEKYDVVDDDKRGHQDLASSDVNAEEKDVALAENPKIE